MREEGPPGPPGLDGGVPVFQVGSVTTGSPNVIITQITPLLYTIDFVLPNVPTSSPNTWTDTQTFAVAAIFQGGFTSNGPTTFSDDVTFDQNAAFNNVTVAGTFAANGTATFQDVSVFNNLSVGNNIAASGGLTVGSSSSLVGGILGRVDGVAAAPGIVGEIIEAEALVGAAVALVTDTPKSVVSIALTAGQWNVYGIVNYAAGPGPSTLTYLGAGISVVDNSFWAASQGVLVPAGGVATAVDLGVVIPPVPVNQPGGLSHFLIAQAGFAVSGLKAYGKIWAIRVR